MSYQQHFSDARDRLDRDLGRIYEHALKVFETFDLSARYVDELLEGVSNEKARADQTQFKAKLKTLIDNLPQLRDIWVVDANGALVLSGTGASTPSADLSSQNYFLEQKNKTRGPFVTDVIEGGASGPRFFAISYRRENADGTFNGVTVISVRAEYFASYYGMLPQPAIASLIREDGAILARFPERPAPAPPKLPENSPILKAFADNPDRGFVEGVSAIDGTERTFVYHRLPETDVYVAMGLDRQTIVGDWLRDLASHLLFGIPGDDRVVRHQPRGVAAHRARGARACAARAGSRAARIDRARLAAIAENGSGRPPDRRHRARLQQSAHRHPRQCRSRLAAHPGQRRARAAPAQFRTPGVGARGHPGAAPARLFPPASARGEVGRHQQARRRHVGTLAADDRRNHRGRNAARRRPLENRDRRQPARKHDPQSRDQFARRDARRRPADHRNRQYPVSTRIMSSSMRATCRTDNMFLSRSPIPAPA